MLPGPDIIRFGRMVKRLLGGSSVVIKEQLAQECASLPNSTDSICDVRENSTIFNLSVYTAGTII
jgi:hypothetical protein